MEIEVVKGIVIDTAIFCEDVRAELNGKISLLGVFAADILVASFPATIRAGIFLQGHSTTTYNGPLNMRIRLDDSDVVVFSGALNVEPGLLAIPVSGLALAIPAAGTLRLEVTQDDAKWIEVMQKSIKAASFKDGVLIPPTA